MPNDSLRNYKSLIKRIRDYTANDYSLLNFPPVPAKKEEMRRNLVSGERTSGRLFPRPRPRHNKSNVFVSSALSEKMCNSSPSTGDDGF